MCLFFLVCIMSILRVTKRDPSTINNEVDFNPSVFKYYVDRIEVKKESVKNGLKPAFCGMLDELLRPDEANYTLDGNWNFSDPTTASTVIGGTTTIINTYEGVKYVYRQATQILINAAVPANLNGFAGLTYKASLNPMTFASTYTLTTDLNEITHGELIQDGQANTIVPISNLGGTPRISATFRTTNAGYGPIQPGEQGTHGIDEFGYYRPITFWNETVVNETTQGADEYYATLTESNTGFTLNTKKILFALRDNGDALPRYNPIDLVTFANLIKLHYFYRYSTPVEAEI